MAFIATRNMLSASTRRRLLTIFFFLVYDGATQTYGSGSDDCSDSFSCIVTNNTLKFLFMSSSDSQFDNSGSFIAAEIAVEQVNAAEDVLQAYSLAIANQRDSKCDGVVSLKEFVSQVTGPEPKIVGVVGTGCAAATKPVAEISYFWDLPVISYASSVSQEDSVDTLPSYYQLLPPEDNYIPAIAAIILQYQWKKVGVITENEDVFLNNVVHLADLLEPNVTVLSTPILESNQDPADVEDLFVPGARIFFVNTYENKARQIICEAYKMNFTHPNYAWIFLGSYSGSWWMTESGPPTSCTSEQMQTVTNRSLVAQQYPVIEDINAKAIGNLSYSEFHEIYTEKLEGTSFTSTPVAHVTYDAVWTLALALNQTLGIISSGGDDSCDVSLLPAPPASRFDYLGVNIACLMQRSLQSTDFLGLTGAVQFTASDRSRGHQSVRIFQYREEAFVQIGKYDDRISFTFQYIGDENDTTVYPEGIPPDGTPIKIISAHHTATVVILYTLATLGLFLAAFCLVFNIVYRNHKAVRLTSPLMNYFIISGSVLIYISVYIRVLPSNEEEVWKWMCGLGFCLGGFGYTLSFGPILAKMWRVFQVFHLQFTRSSIVPNPGTKHMLILVIIINSIQAVLLTAGFIPDSVRPGPVEAMDREHPSGRVNDQGIEQQFCIYNCFPLEAYPWLIICFLYLVLLQFLAVILAIQTRNVKIRILNDSKEVAIIIYFTSIVMIVMLLATFILSDYNNLSDGIFGSCLMLSTSVTLIVIFLPKMWWLYKDKTGEHVTLERGKSFTNIEVEKGGAIKVHNETTIAVLQKQIESLEARLEEKTELDKQNQSKFNSSRRSTLISDTFKGLSSKMMKRSTKSEITVSENQEPLAETVGDNDVFVTEHKDQADVNTKSGAVRFADV